jgi:hypothetical protein
MVRVSIGIFDFTTTYPNTQHEKTILTKHIGSQLHNYTLNEITSLDNISEQGIYINKVGKITGLNNNNGLV